MKTLLTTNLKWICLGVAGIVLCLIVFRRCNTLPDHADGKRTVDSVTSAYAADKKVAMAQIDSLTREDRRKDWIMDSLVTKLHVVQQDLAVRGKAIATTLARDQQARIDKDTAAIVSNCDTLARQVEAGMLLVGGYENLTDSLVKAGKDQARTKDSLAMAFMNLYRKSDAALGIVTKQYNDLYPDYVKARRGLNFNKGLSRVLAAAVIAAAVKIFIIK